MRRRNRMMLRLKSKQDIGETSEENATTPKEKNAASTTNKTKPPPESNPDTGEEKPDNVSSCENPKN